MAFDYSVLADEAEELINEFGRTAYLVRQSRDAKDPLKPWRGNDNAIEERSCTAVVMPLDSFQVEPERALERQATNIAYIAASSHEDIDVKAYHFLDESDRLTRWRVVSVQEIAPANTKLLFVLFLSR